MNVRTLDLAFLHFLKFDEIYILFVGMDSAKVLDEMTEKLSGIYKGLDWSKKSSAMLPQEIIH